MTDPAQSAESMKIMTGLCSQNMQFWLTNGKKGPADFIYFYCELGTDC